MRALKRIVERECPDVIHVKGRIVTEVLDVLPAERTILHIATSGARDGSWTDGEVESFRAFAERCAAVLAPGAGVAERFKREFGVTRKVTPVFTMAPDEWSESMA